MGLTPEQHQGVDAYLAKHAGYRELVADADQVKADIRECRVALTVSGYMRQLAFAHLRLEAARLTGEKEG